MRTPLLFLIAVLFSIVIVKGQTTRTVGGSGANYSTLQLAFAAINSGAIQGQIVLQITGNTTETALAVLNASGSGNANFTSITIYPTVTGLSISGNLPSPLFDLNGADNVVLDGRVNQSGAKNLVVANNSSGSSASTIRFINSAENNSVKYCIIKGSPSGAGIGIIQFSTAAAGNGNDNNTVDNNDITCVSDANRPLNAIYSGGSSGRENSTNTISNNNIYNFFNAANSSRGINVAFNSNDWTISGNSFYETTTVVPSGGFTYQVIYIGTTTNHMVSGNYIGGSTSQCGGSAMTVNSSFAHYFAGLYISGGTSTPVTLQNNIVKNINYTSTNSNPWDGIYLSTGITNVDVRGNTIGATTGTGSIVITTPNASAKTTISVDGAVTAINLYGGGSGFTTAPTVTFSTSGSTTSATATATISGGVVTGFTVNTGGIGYTSPPSVNINGATYSTSHGIRHLNTGTVTISNNNIGSVTTIGNDFYSHCFEAIVISGSAPSISITNNLIGSLSEANSIQTSSAAGSSLVKQDLRGIYLNSSVTTSTISGNTIANMYNAYTGNNASKFDGICTSGGSNTILNNTVRNLSTPSNTNITVKGIQQTVLTSGTNQSVTGNTVYNLSNTNSSAANCRVYGIDFACAPNGTNTVSGNFVHSLSLSSSSITCEIFGIVLSGGLATTSNNIVNLGEGLATGYKIYGIFDNSGNITTNNNSIYFNSIYVGGTVSPGTTSPTAAIWNSNDVCIRNYRNNILMNSRTGGSTGKHYAIRIGGKSGLTIDYNDYFGTIALPFSGNLNGVGAGDYFTFAGWETATGQDVNSTNSDPGFAQAGGTSVSNYNISAVLTGVSGTGITTDYSGITRGATPKVGALETNSYVWQGGTSTAYNTAANWSPAEVPPAGADITFAATPSNDCVLDQNRTVGTVTNTQSTYKLLTNGFQLTINKNLTFTGGAQIDAKSASSLVVFAGTSAQTIPMGAFVDNTVYGLTLNNSNGLTLNSDLSVTQTLTLTSGNLTIGANTLTINGAVVKTSGTLTGGATSNISVGGTGASTSLPTITLHNLTLNRPNGITLGGSVSVAGTLTLTSGILTVGANTLTISGSSPISSGGTIDASNGSAGLIFANPTAITLPTTFFNGNINNLTISGAGGVTAGSDITVNSILNLQAANPSATKGLLEMVSSYGSYPGRTSIDNGGYTTYSTLVSHTLFMGPSATTTGTGDVTGIVKRNFTITANTPYTFGNQYTTISLTAGTTMPSSLSVTITIGSTAIGPIDDLIDNDIIRDAVKRTYEIIPANNASGNFVTANFHYLNSELTSNITSYVNTEQKLTTMDYDIGPGGFKVSDEHGRANYDYTNKYIGLSSVPISYFIYNASTHDWRTIFTLRDYGVDYFTWNGLVDNTWGTAANWTLSNGGTGIPTELSHIIIPDVATTRNHSPILPSSVTINTLSIENGGILTMGNSTLTIQNFFSGGWEDQNPLGNDPGTSTVIFNRKNTTISGNARFHNVQISSDETNVADITNQTGSTMKIAGSIARTGSTTGKWYADVFDATIEYNGGAQTIIHPDGTPDYHHLTLSGSGTKTMPGSALTLHGNLKLAGTATLTAAGNVSIGGNLEVGSGTTFGTGAFSHTIGGEIICNGTITAVTGSSVTCGSHFTNNDTFNGAVTSNLTFNGAAIQTIGGTHATTFGNVIINNAAGVKLTSDALTTISGDLTINSSKILEILAGKRLTVTGSITNNGGTSGLIIRSESDGATGTGSLINATIGVNATVERWMSGDIWHLISPTATAGDAVSNFLGVGIQNSNLIARNANNYALSPYLTGTDDWDYYKVSGSNVTGNFGIPAKGYQILRATDAGTGQGNVTDDGIVSFKGALGAANLSIGLVKTGNRWNLLGNPFPCALDVAKFLTSNSSVIDPAYLFIYVSKIADVTAYGYEPNVSGLNLSSGEGFFVKAKDGGTSPVNFTTSMKSHSSDAFKSALIEYPNVKLTAETGLEKATTTVKYIPGMSKGLDPGWDAGLFNNGSSYFSLYTRLVQDYGVDFTIQCLPDNDYDNLIIPVGLVASNGSSVTFKAEAINLPVGYKVYLEDRSNAKFTRLDDGSVYTVSLSADSQGTGRFYIHTNQIVSAIPDDLSNKLAIIAYPQQHLVRILGDVNLPARASVYDINGKLVTSKSLTGVSENEIPLINASSGLYLIKIESKNTTRTKKIIWIKN